MANPTGDESYHRKLALIINNYDYKRSNVQINYKKAESLSKQLKTIHFEVKVETNIISDIMRPIQKFAEKIQDGDLVLVYFSGLCHHTKNKNYLLPVGDNEIEADINFQDNANDVNRIIERLVEKNPSYATVMILDCCMPYVIESDSATNVIVEGNGLVKIRKQFGAFIQLTCDENETVNDDLFIQYLLINITQKNLTIPDLFQYISDTVYSERHNRQRPLFVNGLPKRKPIYFNLVPNMLPSIPMQAQWRSHAITVAGRQRPGSVKNRLRSPHGISISKKQALLIADSLNHRIMSCNLRTRCCQRIAGKNMQSHTPQYLARPSSAIVDTNSNAFIICDYHNRRVLRWLRGNRTYSEAIIGNEECYAVVVDNEDTIYVSDTEFHRVVRYQADEISGTVVAGGNGQGPRLKQLNHPTYICVDDNQAVYISDSWNDRVVRWDKGAEEGVLEAGGEGKGKDLTQLDCPAGIVIDQLGTLYVADHWNHRVMRYRQNEKPDIIAGDRFLPGSDNNQLSCPEGLAFDKHNNLYVADSNNHRVQKFSIRIQQDYFPLVYY